MSKIEERVREFRAFVWNHAVDQFQAQFDVRAVLTDDELEWLLALLGKRNLHSFEAMRSAVAQCIAAERSRVVVLLQLTGMTRNKIIQDIKAFVRSQDIRGVSLSSPAAIFSGTTGIELGSEYLARQILRVFGHLLGKVDSAILETLNQATWPGYVRQERAKRMGHEAEYRLACLLRDCGIPFEPAEKAENPLCRDCQVDGVSYDLVVPSAKNALLRVKSTVHTANIGQYGESKDDLEIREARASIDGLRNAKKFTLLAFIDGVGFESNRAGLTGVLTRADEFCQFRTIWKAVAVAASKIGISLTVALPKPDVTRFREFAGRFETRLKFLTDETGADANWVKAGDAHIRIRQRRRRAK